MTIFQSATPEFMDALANQVLSTFQTPDHLCLKFRKLLVATLYHESDKGNAIREYGFPLPSADATTLNRKREGGFGLGMMKLSSAEDIYRSFLFYRRYMFVELIETLPDFSDLKTCHLLSEFYIPKWEILADGLMNFHLYATGLAYLQYYRFRDVSEADESPEILSHLWADKYNRTPDRESREEKRRLFLSRWDDFAYLWE